MGLIRRFLWWMVGGQAHLDATLQPRIAELYGSIERHIVESQKQEEGLRLFVASMNSHLVELHGRHEKQIADLRAIVAHLGEETKKKPTAARSMAELRQFMRKGDGDAA